jgi:hypothetical protein
MVFESFAVHGIFKIMKCVGKLALGLAVGLVFSAGAQSNDVAVASADNPYTAIAVRNVFGLNPIVASDEPVGDPPPKIMLTGIMSMVGNLQALFKVAGTGKPDGPKDQSYILSEGQRQDDIEVVSINDHANVVTFNNHGTVQEIPLANAPKSALSEPSGPSGPAFGRRGITGSRGRFGGEGADEANNSRHSPPGRPNRGSGMGANQNPSGSGTGGGLNLQSMQSSQTPSSIYNPQQNMPALTPEETAAYIEVQRQAYQSDPNPMNQRIANLLPPTKYSPTPAGPAGNPE